jgi:transcriptional regulator with XRE-family HTH domain
MDGISSAFGHDINGGSARENAPAPRRANPRSDGHASVVLGRSLRQVRIAAGLTLEGVAAGLGLSYQQVQKYERGINRISSVRLGRFAELCGTSPAEILMMAGLMTDASGSEGREVPRDVVSMRLEMSLVSAFRAIRSEAVRRSLVSLARQVAEGQPGTEEE